jgi:radical SAM-linked protein
MMHLMERALRRAHIPYLLSEGFNPHIRLSMGTVLPVGLWGEQEYFDLEVHPIAAVDFMDSMNQVLPPGMGIRQCREIPPSAPSLMKAVNAAEYAFKIKPGGIPDLKNIVAEIMAQSAILVQSRGKNKAVTKDLRQGIYRMAAGENEQGAVINVMVSVNEPLNIRFDELLDVFTSNGIESEIMLDFWRRGNYIREKDKFYLPLDVI